MTVRGTECPRCGYELRGVVDSWSERCPLDGTCTECGLAFAWRDILHPSYRLPTWCVESPQPVWLWASQVLGTIVRAARPRPYWARMAMSQPIRWGRLATWVVTLMVIFVVGLDLGAAAVATADHRETINARTTSPASATKVFVVVASTPWSTKPITTYTWIRRNGAPWTTWALSPRNYVLGFWVPYWTALVTVMCTPLTTALAFAALPWSRRRAKVRARHIVRIALHGTVVAWAAISLAAAGSVWSACLTPPVVRLHWLHLLAAVVLLLGTLLWWRAAVDDYLRMEHPWAVAVSTTLIGLLAPLAIAGVFTY
ncbi:MAG: hypothetical protein ACYTGP_05730 [Planctomycetota bacterium]